MPSDTPLKYLKPLTASPEATTTSNTLLYLLMTMQLRQPQIQHKTGGQPERDGRLCGPVHVRKGARERGPWMLDGRLRV